jgi:hypothetical protein
MPRSGGILGAAPGGGRGSQVGPRLIGDPLYGPELLAGQGAWIGAIPLLVSP